MNLKSYIKEQSIQAIENLFQQKVKDVEIQITKDEFEGDYTLVVFPFVKLVKQKPEEIANKIGSYLTAKEEFIAFNVVKGFLNLSLNPTVFTKLLKEKYSVKDFKLTKKHTEKIMVEYSSPNTNKPIHLGHIRNNLLGFSISNILKAAGNEVLRGQIINDRGIHICKSMLAWKKYGNGETPQTTGIKGDHLVGKYYVIFDQKYKEEIQSLISSGMDADEAKKKAPILLEAQEMLKKWEDGDAEIKALWKEMNSWVYSGFEKTYQRLGVSFDLVQYESDTYLLGKDVIEEGLKKGILFKKEDGSVWADLTEEGLDQKLLLRGDGTSVYITQDLGTAVERFTRYHLNELIYTVGNEQDYHFQVLFLILKKLGYQWADKLYHLSYGMVDLPSGKMKSREGTVVDADELMEEMHQEAVKKTSELGKLEGYTENEKEQVNELIGLGALKYFILKVDPKKRILFDPNESIEFNGNTGPFIQYTYARTCSVLRKAAKQTLEIKDKELNKAEQKLIILLSSYEELIEKSAADLNPALIANYIYEVSKEYNSFYQSNRILDAENESEQQLRLAITQWTGNVIRHGLSLLGIGAPERM
ncbi:arginine--tRNA ligase [Apibacter sp. B3889]|uniref:arginine--tRNA ligase n=1 Tax=unclassified Apibacter TaxID=2630820 RepID=UPI00132BE650|nr:MULTISPECIES: arginine--tRNA ligase [unclassified Apibacter]MXO35257.1 arginine--tRNA ligase [Apibacter sp. B3883]MXO42514.1 arginine--tRNA ligase [Apibacter sp. B3889]MXP04749.1 arginine--tRNA ligase [Apibacter sp. B3887]MXP08454.1 arginine--tRNA ligase [Apibacter sp. B3935]